MPIPDIKPSSKRRRVVTSCSECYRRKQKCDRKSPCNNCVARNVSTHCVYDAFSPAKSAKEHRQSGFNAQPNTAISPVERIDQGAADLGYSLVSDSNTFVGLQEVMGNEEFENITVPLDYAPTVLAKGDIQAFLGKLPPGPVIEELANFFFENVNWHYFLLERFYFDSLLSRWPPTKELEAVSYLTAAELSMELRYFPTLLFQVIALSLQFVPSDFDVLSKLPKPRLSASQMYSDLGEELLSLLGRTGSALSAVHADFLRSSWLKNCGRGTESWHTVGSAIRQAQELRLHKHKEIYQDPQKDISSTLSVFWYEENKKRLWTNLFVWDSFMAMILGRPRMINLDDCDAKLPMNCNIPEDPSTAIPMTVQPEDNYSPIMISAPLFRYAVACKVHRMRASKADNPRLNDYTVVQKLHEDTMSLIDELPPFLRLKNTDTTWDRTHPRLPQLRQELQVMLNLFIMGLHRPHVKSSKESRKAALQAALQTLDCQRFFFTLAEKDQYHLFGLAFYTVDASLLVSIIALLFPPSSRTAKQMVNQSLQHAIEDLSKMQPFNPIARSGLRVLERCYQKVKIICEPPNSSSEPRTASHSTAGDELNALIHDLGGQGFDSYSNLQSDSSQANAYSWPVSPDLFSQPIPDNFNEGYWLDQLNTIDLSFPDRDPDFQWENLYSDWDFYRSA